MKMISVNKVKTQRITKKMLRQALIKCHGYKKQETLNLYYHSCKYISAIDAY